MVGLLYYLPLDVQEFAVYNVWGEKVYEQNEFVSTDESKWWNGEGKDAGTYLIYCKFDYEGEQKTYSGSVQLIR